MGLDAVVFNSLKKMEQKYGRGIFKVDDNGEAYLIEELNFPDTWVADAEYAVSVRIGNVAMLSFYRKHLEKICPHGLIKSFLSYECQKIQVGDLTKLRNEVLKLENYIAHLSEADEIADIMEMVIDLHTLIDVSKKENNPIVFF